MSMNTKKCPSALKGVLLGLILVATLAGPFSKAFAVVDVSNFNKVFIGGKNLYADPATGALYDATGNAVQGDGSGTLQETTQTETGKEAVSAATACNGFWNYWSSPISCTGRMIGVIVASMLIAVTSWLLEISGLLFNWTLNYTVVEFGNFFTGGVKQGVEIGWTVFRDIANILIIGIFTFVAISIILGLKEFGQKKMIANVLIIAVLINFSLLFTKMIVDASNFTAKQLYDATNIGGQNVQNAQVANIGATLGKDDVSYKFTDAGVAGAFIGLMGVTSGAQTFKTLDAGADALNNGWMAFLHGLFSATLFLAAALVLLYGSFLLISRAILIIFLMITASAAFASYLIPAWAGSSYGWKTWWSSLLKVAVFAPLLMLFLWITISMAKAMRPHGGTLGGLLSEPTKAVNLESLFIYIVVLGMLFFSFKLSSAFASRIGGFSVASMIPGIGLGISASLAGLAGRNFLGWGARAARDTMRARGWTGREGNEGLIGGVRRQATIAANRLARASYNPLKPKLAATAATALGVPKMFMGKDAIGAQSFEDKMKQKAKTADDLARQIAPPEATRRAEEQRAAAQVVEERRRHRELMHQAVTQTETLRNAFQQQQQPQAEQRARQNQPDRQDIEQRVQAHQEAITRAENEKSTAQTRQESEMREAHNDIERAATQARHQAELNTIDERARGHREDLTAAQTELTALNAAATRLATQEVEAAQQMQDFNRTIEEGTDALRQYDRETERQAREARHEPERERAQELLWDPRAADDVSGAVRNHERDENLKSLRNILAEGQPQQQPPQAGGNVPH